MTIICCDIIEHMVCFLHHIKFMTTKLNFESWNTSHLQLNRFYNQFSLNVIFSIFALGDCNYFVYSLPRCNNQYRRLPKKIHVELIVTKYKYAGNFQGKTVLPCVANNKQILQIWAKIVKIGSKMVKFHYKGLMCPVFTPFTTDKWVTHWI